MRCRCVRRFTPGSSSPPQALLSDSNKDIDGRIQGRKDDDDREFEKIDEMVREGKSQISRLGEKINKKKTAGL